MRFSVLFLALLILVINSTAQTTADNGLNISSPNNVQLGGTLNRTTIIDQNGFNFHLRNGNTPIFTTLGNGNVGIGNAAPEARLSFPDAGASEEASGMTWSSGSYLYRYGIHRTAGPWAGPNYQQLRVGWETGIILDPGNNFGRSYVDITGNGLRVTSGNVGIGTTNPGSMALAIERSNNDGGATNYPFISIKNTSTTLPAGSGYNVAGTNYSAGNDAVIAQCVTNYGVGGQPPWNSGSGFFIVTKTEHPIIFATGASVSERVRITSTGNVGIGTTAPHSKLEVGTDAGDGTTPYTPTIWDLSSARFNGGNVSIFSSGNQNTAGDSYQLNFYARYYNGGQGMVTNKAAYIKGAAANDYLYPPQAMGRGTLILGSTNTNYNNNTFNDIPAMYVTNGQVGVGINTPEAQLHTTGSVRFAGLTNDNAKDRVIVSDANGNLFYRDAATLGSSSTAGWAFGGNAVPASSTFGTTSNYDLPIITNNTERMRIGANGNVGIGTTSIANYKLSVDGNIRTRKVHIDQDSWADYVFESNYRLRPLKEVEQYIQQEKHLPDVPSAAEVKKEGLDLGDNQVLLLKKIEELTLYVIEQNKKIEEQQTQLTRQQARLEALEKEKRK
jgi:hypothetical protein